MEVVAALAIIAMITAIGLPYLRPGASTSLLRAKASEVAGLLRAGRDEALRSNHRITVLIDAKQGLVHSPGSALTVVMPSGVTMRMLPDSADRVSFLGDGSSSGARLMIAANDKTYFVDVNRITATVEIRGASR